jgi:hypothetical protein
VFQQGPSINEYSLAIDKPVSHQEKRETTHVMARSTKAVDRHLKSDVAVGVDGADPEVVRRSRRSHLEDATHKSVLCLMRAKGILCTSVGNKPK